MNPETINGICNQAAVSDQQAHRCMDAVFFVAMAQANLSSDWALDFCGRLDEKWQGMCFGNSASRLMETDSRNIGEALALCQAAAAHEAHHACFEALYKYSAYTFKVGSDEFYELCHGLPERWRDRCLNQSGRERL